MGSRQLIYVGTGLEIGNALLAEDSLPAFTGEGEVHMVCTPAISGTEVCRFQFVRSSDGSLCLNANPAWVGTGFGGLGFIASALDCQDWDSWVIRADSGQPHLTAGTTYIFTLTADNLPDVAGGVVIPSRWATIVG